MGSVTQGAIHFDAGIGLDQWRRNVQEIRKDLQGLSKTTQEQTKKMDDSFSNLSKAIAGYFSISALSGFIQQVISIRGEFQKTEIAFATMLKSREKASVLMQDMVQLAATTPFGLQEVSQGAKQLLAFQIPLNQVTDTLRRIGDISAGLSVPMGQLIHVYGQVKAQGRLMTNDLYQFMNAGIPMVAELAKVLGVAENKVKDMITAGKVGFPEVQKVIKNLTDETGLFFNLMEKQSGSVSGQISNLQDNIEQMYNAIGEANEGIIYDVISGLNTLVEHYEDVIKVLTVLIATYGAYRAGLMLTMAIQKAQIAMNAVGTWLALARSINTVKDAQALLNLTMSANPLGAVLAVIGLLTTAYIAYGDEIKEALGLTVKLDNAQRSQQAVNEKYTKTFIKGLAEQRTSIQNLIYIIKNEASTLEQRKRAYEKLISIDSAFRDTLDAQYRQTNKLGDAFDYVVKKMERFAMAQAQMQVKQEKLREYTEKRFEAGTYKAQIDDLTAERNALIKLREEKRKQGVGTADLTEKIRKLYLQIEPLAEKWQKVNKEANQSGILYNGVTRQIESATKNIQKGNAVLEAQIKGGKINGEIISKERKAELQQKLKDNKEMLKFYIGITPELDVPDGDIKKESWYQKITAQLKEVERQMQEDAPDQATYRRLEKQKKILEELLNPPKAKKETEKQLAEIYPEGSLRDLERRMQLLNDALQTASDNQVKIRKFDIYGNDKDKKGNPLLTGEILSYEEANKRVVKLNEEIEAQKRRIQARSFDEEVQELERQWNVRYQIAKVYGEEVAKAQFPTLKGESFYDEMTKLFKPLNVNVEAGVTLSETDLKKWEKLKGILDGLNGVKDPFTNFTESLDDSTSGAITASEKIEILREKLYSLSGSEISEKYKAEIYNRIYLEEEALKNAYRDFMNEHKTYEEKKTAITKTYEELRSKAQTDAEKKKIDKAEKKDISELNLSVFKEGADWQMAFSNLEFVSNSTIKRIIANFEEFKNAQAKNLQPTELRELEETLSRLRERLNINPFSGIIRNFSDYRNALKEVQKAEKEYQNIIAKSGKYSDEAIEAYKKLTDAERKLAEEKEKLVGKIQKAQEIFNASVEAITEISEAFGGMSDATKDAIQDISNIANSAFDFAKSLATGDVAGMIRAGAKLISSIADAISGDKRRERNIKKWNEQVEALKDSYNLLSDVMKDIAGSGHEEYQRKLIANLRQQQEILRRMRNEEADKKKADRDKINGYNSQIASIDAQINDLLRDFKQSVTTTDFRSFSQEISDALVNAFQSGEDAAQAFDDAVEKVMRNAVANALRVKILEPEIKKMVDMLYNSMGYGNATQNAQQQAQLLDLEKQLAQAQQQFDSMGGGFSPERIMLMKKIEQLKAFIDKLKQDMANQQASGSFDGLTQEERDKIKAMGEQAMQDYMNALQQYSDLFGSAGDNAETLKGAVKGVTEKTAGLLEGQINAMRINQVEILKLKQLSNQIDQKALILLERIEENTQPIRWIYELLKKVIG